MTRKAISTDTAPAALGPYSQAIVAGSFVFCSGTVGIDPATGIPGYGVGAQTERRDAAVGSALTVRLGRRQVPRCGGGTAQPLCRGERLGTVVPLLPLVIISIVRWHG